MYSAIGCNLPNGVNAIFLQHCMIILSKERVQEYYIHFHEGLPFELNAPLSTILDYILVFKRFSRE